MKNKYLLYGIINFLVLVAYIYSTYFYFLIIWIVGIVFPFILITLLKLELRYIQMDIQGPKQGKVGQSLSFTTEVKSRYRLLVSGRIDYVFVYKNMTLKNELKRNIFIPLGIKTARKNQEYTATYCGKCHDFI